MNWFTDFFGFDEGTPEETRARLRLHGTILTSRASCRSYRTGVLEIPRLQDLRATLAEGDAVSRATLDKRYMKSSKIYKGRRAKDDMNFEKL